MARIRSIKPEFWIDEKIVDLSMAARLLFIGIWNFADDQGYIEHKPRRIKMQVFPGDDIDIEKLIDELIDVGLVAEFDSPLGPLLHVRNWQRHQRVDKAAQPRFAESSLSPREPSPKPPRTLAPDLDLDLDLERKGREGKGVPPSAAAPPMADDGTAPEPSPTQRSKRITDAYAEVEPMCRWPAINGVVLKALKTGRWTDDEIRDGLLRLAKEGRSVTVDTLRIELSGQPPGNALALARASPRRRTGDDILAEGLDLAARMKAQEQP